MSFAVSPTAMWFRFVRRVYWNNFYHTLKRKANFTWQKDAFLLFFKYISIPYAFDRGQKPVKTALKNIIKTYAHAHKVAMLKKW